MKILRPALIAAILCCFAAGAAFADDIHVVFDPQTLDVSQLSYSYEPVYSLNSPITFTWSSCATNGYLVGTPLANETECASFANFTGAPISEISFNFIANTAISGASSISCDSIDPQLNVANCPSGTTFQTGQTVTADFTGTMPIPVSNLPNEVTLFFIAEDGVAAADINNLNWTASAPEPSSITLLAAGMGLIGLCMVFVKR